MNLSVFVSVLQIYETKTVVFMVNIVYPKLHTQWARTPQPVLGRTVMRACACSVLQLTSYVEDGGEKDNVAVLRALQAQMHAKMAAAHAFLNVSGHTSAITLTSFSSPALDVDLSLQNSFFGQL